MKEKQENDKTKTLSLLEIKRKHKTRLRKILIRKEITHKEYN